MINELLTSEALSVLLVAFGVGIVVGLTGMGGGALMTPALIFLGVNPAAAVANDLVAASVNKSVGAAVHWRQGSPNLKLAAYLMVGSVPFAFAGGFIVKSIEVEPAINPIATILVGAFGGLLVGITSVGSGSLIMVSLLLLYPTLAAPRLVGTDLVQAVPLVLAAAVGHVITEGVIWAVLIPLIVGGMPGTYVGAKLAGWVSQSVIRRGIVIVLTLTGLKMLGMPPEWVGIIGAGLLLLGPLAWGFLRQRSGLEPFDNDSTAWRVPDKR